MAKALSPCVKLCVLHEATKICLGCGRTLDEIAQWGLMPEAERLAIMARLDAREIPSVRRAALQPGQARSIRAAKQPNLAK